MCHLLPGGAISILSLIDPHWGTLSVKTAFCHLMPHFFLVQSSLGDFHLVKGLILQRTLWDTNLPHKGVQGHFLGPCTTQGAGAFPCGRDHGAAPSRWGRHERQPCAQLSVTGLQGPCLPIPCFLVRDPQLKLSSVPCQFPTEPQHCWSLRDTTFSF